MWVVLVVCVAHRLGLTFDLFLLFLKKKKKSAFPDYSFHTLSVNSVNRSAQ